VSQTSAIILRNNENKKKYTENIAAAILYKMPHTHTHAVVTANWLEEINSYGVHE
jgi:hypothetical protein